MKLITKLFAVCAAGLSAVSILNATPDWSAVDTVVANDPQMVGMGYEYSGLLDITTSGFIPSTMVVTSATVSFSIYDLLQGGDGTVGITLDNALFISGVPVSTNWISAGVTGTFLSSLNVDGMLNYTVTVTDGLVLLNESKLDAWGTVRQAVPDGGTTLVLIGLGLIGLLAARKHIG